MAKSAYNRWRGWRVDASGTTIADENHARSRKRKRAPGITNEQGKQLAALQRRAGLRYTGRGMSQQAAAALIVELQRETPAPLPGPARAMPTRSGACRYVDSGWSDAEWAVIEDAIRRRAA